MPVRSSSVVEPRFSSDFWKFWTGQTISTLGSSFTSFALPLLIFKLTGSSLNLALTVTATVLPYLLFGLVIGAWVDRVNRKRLMVVTDLARWPCH
jgi:MFS family permease